MSFWCFVVFVLGVLVFVCGLVVVLLELVEVVFHESVQLFVSWCVEMVYW